MEVRCCCDAHLIGYLPDAPNGAKAVTFYSGKERKEVIFEVDTIKTAWHRVLGEPGYSAYKSRDYPEELLDGIPEFTRVSGGVGEITTRLK